ISTLIPFSPLHAGLVVVSLKQSRIKVLWLHFQSPTRRVSGCNGDFKSPYWADLQPFSPLHVGSVVVTLQSLAYGSWLLNFQSPTRRVSGCNTSLIHRMKDSQSLLSVPYTSGQWL